MCKCILIASNGNNIGKSTTARLLKDHLGGEVMSFADPIRKQVKELYMGLCTHPTFDELYERYPTFDELYTQERKNEPILEGKSVRELVNEYSDLVQKMLSPQVWARIALNNILKSDASLVIFDDFRRVIEYDYLKDHLEVFTIYLDKADKNQVHTPYEGQLENFEFDLRFTFDKDYGNVQELLRACSLMVKQ